jgi:hypothetical protein
MEAELARTATVEMRKGANKFLDAARSFFVERLPEIFKKAGRRCLLLPGV